MMTNLALQHEVLQRNTHMLSRLTLVGWYLFDAIDIDFKFQATHLIGSNGSGKSSILDAIQTIMAGGDENKINLNGASSDKGTRSGRSLRSYCLGAVDDGLTRKTSNTYLVMTFERPDGSEYAMGISIYASDYAGKQITKNTFVLPNSGVTSKDLFVTETEVATWDQFKRANLSDKKEIIYPTSASDFRQLYCESMGYDRTSKLDSGMVFSALSKGLALKQELNFTKFCRSQILPEDKLDVDGLEGTFKDFKQIKDQILEAEAKQTLLESIIGSYEKALKSSNKAVGYNWADAEAECISKDNHFTELSDRKGELEAKKQIADDELQKLDLAIPNLEAEYQNAYDAYSKSEHAQQRKSLIDEQELILEENRKHELSENILIKSLKDLVRTQLPDDLSVQVGSQIKKSLSELENAMRANSKDDLISTTDTSWLDDEKSVSEVIMALEALRPSVDLLKKQYDQLAVHVNSAKESFSKTDEQLKNALKGVVTYSRSTEELIEALKQKGIKSKPVGALVSVTDPTWQQAVESYLGGNREALIIFDEYEHPVNDAASIDRAIREYRALKKERPELGRTKIIKDIIEPRTRSSFSNNIAASLIHSENDVALGYMQQQLGQVELVETDAELRQSKRAVARDGTVSSGATVGGGRRVENWLIGSDSAKRNAELLSKQLDDASLNLNYYSTLKSSVDQLISQLLKNTEQLTYMVGSYVTSRKEYDNRKKRLEQVISVLSDIAEQNEAERLLKERLDLAKAEKAQASKARDSVFQQQAKLTADLENLAARISEANQSLENAIDKRKQIEGHPDFDSASASQVFVELENKLGESGNYENDEELYKALSEYSQQNHKKCMEVAAKTIKNASEKLFGEYLGKYQVNDAKEFHERDDLWQLTRCKEHLAQIVNTDIVRYRLEAEAGLERLVHSFRSEVLARLQDNFIKLEGLFFELNRSLRDIRFNGYKYKFTYDPVNTETLYTIYDYAKRTDKIELEAAPDGLFATNEDHPAIKIIESILDEERLDEVEDYRNFYTFDLKAKRLDDKTDDKWRSWDDLIGVGSGGEKGTPLYIALGASYMSAFQVQMINGKPRGGAVFAVFDEAFGKIDGNNTTSALAFLKQIGLQIILASPPEDKLKMSQGVDRTYGVIRSGSYVELDYEEYTEAGKSLYLSDIPHVNQKLVEERMKQMEADRKRKKGGSANDEDDNVKGR